ncbi:MAG: hypothetical protein ABW076_18720 [Candidatus Thiodiazotropha sp.]
MSHISKNICFRVMAEYGSSGIWEFVHDETGPWRHSMANYRRLGLPDELERDFKEWISDYEDKNLAGELDHVQFNCTGLSLAYRLYDHLDKSNYVEYQGELEGGDLDDPIEIGSL